MSLAALFSTFWNLERRFLGQPAKSKVQQSSLEKTNVHNNFLMTSSDSGPLHESNKVPDSNGGDVLLERESGMKRHLGSQLCQQA